MKDFMEAIIIPIIGIAAIYWFSSYLFNDTIENTSVDRFMACHSIDEFVDYIEENGDPYYILEELGEDRKDFLLEMLSGYGPLEDNYYYYEEEGYEQGYENGYEDGIADGYDEGYYDGYDDGQNER